MQVVAETGFLSMENAVMTVDLEPATPYVLVSPQQIVGLFGDWKQAPIHEQDATHV